MTAVCNDTDTQAALTVDSDGLGLGLILVVVSCFRLYLAFCVFFCFSLDCFFLMLFAFVVLSLVSYVLHQETGCKERLPNDLFCVEWGVKP